MVCDGQKLRVTSSLKIGLRYIRAYGCRREAFIIADNIPRSATNYRHLARLPLWIDAICIDQGNLQERARQVAKMASIYQFSSTTLVWLGVPGKHLLDPLRGISIPQPTDEPAAHPRSQRKRDRLKFWRRQRTAPAPTERDYLSPNYRSMLDSIVKLDWFWRRWVLQEMFSARECEILWGDFICSRRRMHEMLDEAKLRHRAPPLQPYESDRTLLEVCWRFAESHCTDGRDRIFALRHTSREGPRIDVDYSLSVRDVYLQVMLDTVFAPDENQSTRLAGDVSPPSMPRGFAILQMLAVASCQPRPPGLDQKFEVEAWMPDWRRRSYFKSDDHHRAVEFCFSPALQEGHHFREAWSLPYALEFTETGYGYLSVRGKLLHCRGAKISDPRSRSVRQHSALERVFRARLPPGFMLQSSSDCVWVPYVKHRSLMVGFVLRSRSNEKHAYHRGKPVYFVYSCFVIDNDDNKWRPSVLTEANLEKLAGFEMTPDAQFHLE